MPEQNVPPLVITDPTSDAGREVVERHVQATEATRILHACQQAQRDAYAAVRIAEGALAAELDRGAVAGEQNAKAEIALVRKIEDTRIAADPSLHAPRIAAATQRQANAVLALRSHTGRTIADLLDELRPEAERVTAELQAAREQLVPFERAYAETAARVATLTESVHRGRRLPPQNKFSPIDTSQTVERWQLPADGAVPMPDAAVIDAWDRQQRPELYSSPIIDAEPTEPVAVVA